MINLRTGPEPVFRRGRWFAWWSPSEILCCERAFAELCRFGYCPAVPRNSPSLDRLLTAAKLPLSHLIFGLLLSSCPQIINSHDQMATLAILIRFVYDSPLLPVAVRTGKHRTSQIFYITIMRNVIYLLSQRKCRSYFYAWKLWK